MNVLIALLVVGISVQVAVYLQEIKKDEKTERKKLSVPLSRRQSSRQVVRTGSVKCLSSLYKSEQPECKEIKPE